MADGSFSQFSVTYHRLLLDTLSLVELWCRFQNLPTFSLRYLERVGKAAGWLYAMVDDVTGDAPNMGANDGAHILNYFAAPYRDYRYSTELACLLFRRRCAFPGPISDTVRNRFYLTAVGNMERQEITRFEKGGYGLARSADTWMLLRVPTFKFRPSHADVMHLDVWRQGINWLRDGGTFSYNTEPKWLDYFAGSRSHNVVEFDDQAQMPRLSRFLFGGWPQYEFLRTEKDENSALRLESACVFWHGGRHHRTAILTAQSIEIIDVVENFNDSARVRWRLAPENWTIVGNTVSCQHAEIKVSADLPLSEFTVTQGYESRYYGLKDSIPVLEVGVRANKNNNLTNTSKNTASITTIISWS
jgi:hypothetical protein